MVVPGSAPETSTAPTISENMPPMPPVSEILSPEPLAAKIRLSEELYLPDISLSGWKPYFTGEEPEWKYNPDEPWLWNRDGGNSHDQTPASEAHTSLYTFLESYAHYAGCFVNSNGYLTVMLKEPTIERANEIAKQSAAPVWIVEANYSYETLRKALDEVFPAITSWMDEHPEAPIGGLSGGIRDDDNRVYLNLSGSGIPMLLEAFDFPGCIELVYTLTVDPSEPHDVPRAPITSWEKDGVTIKSAQESYPVGTASIPVTASHDVENMRLYAPDSLLSVEKYVSGEWYDVSGNFSMNALYTEIFDIPAGAQKTVSLRIITPEILGPGLYRATFHGHVCLSSSGDTTINSAIAGIGGKDMVTFEFVIAEDAPLQTPPEVRAIYLAPHEGGQLSFQDIENHPEILTVNSFSGLKEAFQPNCAIWIDKDAISLVDETWLHEEPQMYRPLVLVGLNDALYSFRECLSGFDIEGPLVNWSEQVPEPGFSVWVLLEKTGTSTSSFIQGYSEVPSVSQILAITDVFYSAILP
jgi:hypothetical protein